MRYRIRDFVLGLGVDDVGVATVSDYHSPRSPALESIMPGVRSLVVLAFRELSNCRSGNMQIAMGGRLDTMEFMRTCNFRTARFIEKDLGAAAMTVPPSYPLEMSRTTGGTIGDVSLRHAAVAAGLGNFGRHNLVIHPEMGTTVLFTAILTDLELESDPPVAERLCDDCNICVESCPAGALDSEGRTDDMKCLRQSQPYGLNRLIRFWLRYTGSEPEERQRMLKDEEFWRLYQAGFIGFQYFCFNCYTSCPAGGKG